MLEVRAMAQVTQVLRQSQQVRNGSPPAVIVLSMVGRNYRLTQDMRNAAEALKLPIANTALILRQIYADAPGQANVVWSMGSRGREAAAEIDQLFRELLPDVAEGKVRRIENPSKRRITEASMAERRSLVEGLKHRSHHSIR